MQCKEENPNFFLGKWTARKIAFRRSVLKSKIDNNDEVNCQLKYFCFEARTRKHLLMHLLNIFLDVQHTTWTLLPRVTSRKSSITRISRRLITECSPNAARSGTRRVARSRRRKSNESSESSWASLSVHAGTVYMIARRNSWNRKTTWRPCLRPQSRVNTTVQCSLRLTWSTWKIMWRSCIRWQLG